MATDFKIHIDLTNIPGENEEAKQQLKSFNTGGAPSSNDERKQAMKSTVAVTSALIVADTLVDVGKSAINYIAGSQGAVYGDRVRQNKVNNVMNYAGTVGGIITSTIAGGKLAGPWGAAIAGALSVVTEAVEGLQRVADWERNQYSNNLNEFRNSERLGLMKTDRNRR